MGSRFSRMLYEVSGIKGEYEINPPYMIVEPEVQSQFICCRSKYNKRVTTK